MKSIFEENFRESKGYEHLDYGYTKKLKPEIIFRLIASNGWIYPQIEQAPEMSNEDWNIISLQRIKSQKELIALEDILTQIL